jgi:hypothetical protein
MDKKRMKEEQNDGWRTRQEEDEKEEMNTAREILGEGRSVGKTSNDGSLAWIPHRILFDGSNISFDASLVIYI